MQFVSKRNNLSYAKTMKKKVKLETILTIMQHRTHHLQTASELIIQQYGRDPFLVLIFCMLSLRTRDSVALHAATTLFSLAKTPEQILALSAQEIEKHIYPVGFYKRKAIQIRKSAEIIVKKYEGKAPSNENELLSLPGVGRKTMNLVLQDAFLQPAFCVDTHVHRVANKLGLLHTNTPEQTELALRSLLPQSKWKTWNRALLLWGQYICKPWNHACSTDIAKHP
jgi:endonuclease III